MKITNTSKANQGVHTTDGLQFIEPGQTRDLNVADDYLERVKSLPFLTVDGGPLDHDHKDGPGGSIDELDQMKVADLKALAAVEEIDLGKLTKRDDVIAAIRAARVAQAASSDEPTTDEDVRTDDELRVAVIEQLGPEGADELDRAAMLALLTN